MDNEAKKKEYNYLGIGGISALVICALLIINYHFVLWVTEQKLSTVGEFGDMFGAVNALFSGLAFVGVIIAIMMQSKELELQREELKQTREELKGQKEQLELQNETMQKQQFEHTFFQLLKLHNDHEVEDLFSKINRVYTHLESNYGNPVFEDKKDDAKEVIETLIADMESSHAYLNVLHNLIMFVDKSSITDKKFYVKLVKSEVSQAYLQLLYYFTIIPDGEKMFSALEKEYNLFENLDFDEVIRM